METKKLRDQQYETSKQAPVLSKHQLEALTALKDMQLQHARLLYMIAHMFRLGKISDWQKLELKYRVLQDDITLIEFYKEHRELHQTGPILSTNMSLYSQSQKSLNGPGKSVIDKKKMVKELIIRGAKQQAAAALESEAMDPQVEFQNLELFYDKLVEFANENVFPFRYFPDSSENGGEEIQSLQD